MHFILSLFLLLDDEVFWVHIMQ